MDPIIITEPNATIASAFDVVIPPVGADPVLLAGEIGDVLDGADDVDLVAFALEAGDLVAIEARTPDTTDLDPILRLFGPGGGEVAFDDGGLEPFDPRITFLAPVAGFYTAGVSSIGNDLYDPEVGGSGFGGFDTGPYELAVSSLEPPTVDPELAEANDTILEAADVTAAFEADGEVILTGFIGDNPDVLPEDDVDLLRLALASGEGLRVTVEGAGFGDGFLDPVVRAFTSSGIELATQVLDEGAIGFVAPSNGDFVVGVSTFANTSYDPSIEGSGFDGFGTGLYRVAVEPFDLELDLVEPDDTLLEAPDLTASLADEDVLIVRGLIGDDPDLASAADDVDLVSFELDAGDRLFLTIDGEFLSGLDAVLRVFGPDGVEVAQGDNEFGLDPEIDFTVSETGTFTVGVSASANTTYDPTVEGSGADGFSTGLYELFVELVPRPDPIRGTPGDDRLVGDDGPDTIRGLAGDDVLLGRAGDDDLRGNRGDDDLRGGSGDDLLLGGAGDDLLRGGGGDDVLRGGEGDDILRGGAGANILVGGPGSDTFVLTGQDDVVRGFDVLSSLSERTFDTIVIGPGLVLRSERDFFELALSERAGYDLDFEADEAGVIRRADVENVRTGEAADIEIAGDDMTLQDYVLFQAEQIGLLLPA